MTSTPPPPIRARLAVAVGVACAAAAVSAYATHVMHNASDFTWFYRAGAAVLARQSPYAAIDSTGPYPYTAGFYYTMPAAIAGVPFALLPIAVGKALWCAVLAGLLAFVITRDGWWRLPLLMSFPMLWCVKSGQWAPVVLASVYVPALGWVALGKPTLGAVGFFGQRTFRGAIIFALAAAAAFLLCLLVLPRWPLEYLAELGGRQTRDYQAPIATLPFGPLIAAAALRYRRADARLVLALACVPQAMLFYDQLPLAAVARSFRQALLMALLSYAPIAVVPFLRQPVDTTTGATTVILAPVLVVMYFLPCVAMVLVRENRSEAAATESPVPAGK